MAESMFFGPGESVILSGKGQIEQPVNGGGVLYLTNHRLFLIHKSGIIRKREIPLLDLPLTDISYVRTEGSLRKVLIVGARSANGLVTAYKVHVANPDSWAAGITSTRAKG